MQYFQEDLYCYFFKKNIIIVFLCNHNMAMNIIYQLRHDLYKEVIEDPYIEWFKQIQFQRQTSQSPIGEARKRLIGRCIVISVGYLPIVNYIMYLVCKFFKATADDQLHDALENDQDTLAYLYLKSGFTFSKCSDKTIAKIFNDKLSTTLAYLRDEAPLSWFQSIKTFDALPSAMDSIKDTLLVCFLKAHQERNNMQSKACEQLKSQLFSTQKRYQLHIDHTDILTHINWALDGVCSFSLFHLLQKIDSERKMQIFVESLKSNFTASRCTQVIVYIFEESDLSPEKRITFILQCLESTRQSRKIREFLRANQYEDAPLIQAIDLLYSQKKWKDLQPFISIAIQESECNLILQKIINCICQNLPEMGDKKSHGELLNVILQFPNNTIIDLFEKILGQGKIDQMPYYSIDTLLCDKNVGRDIFDILFKNLQSQEIIYRNNVFLALQNNFHSIENKKPYIESLKDKQMFYALICFTSDLSEKEEADIWGRDE